MSSSPPSTFVVLALAWRIFISSFTVTFFQPDEYFQCLEIAHHYVFGYGHQTWEWTSNPPIRSIVFPALYMPIYWILKVTGLDNTRAIIVGPKLFHGALVSITDIATYKLAKQLLGDRYANTAFVLSLSSLFHILALGRTLANSLETALTTLALCYWPWHTSAGINGSWLSLSLAALACMIRPTNALIWLFLSAELLWRFRGNWKALRSILSTASSIAFLSVCSLIAADSLYYGRITFTPLNFLLTNLSSVSLFYGHSPWHYYLSQGLPIILNVLLPPFIMGSRQIIQDGQRHERLMLSLISWTVFVYSLLGHKEWRFLHPILPIMLIVATKHIVQQNSTQEKPKSPRSRSFLPSYSRMQLFLLTIGLLPAPYLMRYHGSAQIEVMHYLREQDPLHSVGFLMPCHSIPWQSYLHRPSLDKERLWALGCEPPTRGQDLSKYQDQSDIFYNSPILYLKKYFPDTVDPTFPPSPYPVTMPGATGTVERWNHRWPSHLVFFGALLQDDEGNLVRNYIEELGYKQTHIINNGFEEDSRRRGGVQVWTWKP